DRGRSGRHATCHTPSPCWRRPPSVRPVTTGAKEIGHNIQEKTMKKNAKKDPLEAVAAAATHLNDLVTQHNDLLEEMETAQKELRTAITAAGVDLDDDSASDIALAVDVEIPGPVDEVPDNLPEMVEELHSASE